MKLENQIQIPEDWDVEKEFLKINNDNSKEHYINLVKKYKELNKYILKEKATNKANGIISKYIYYLVYPFRHENCPKDYPAIFKRYNSLLRSLREIVVNYPNKNIEKPNHPYYSCEEFLIKMNEDMSLLNNIFNENLDVYLCLEHRDSGEEYECLVKEENGTLYLRTLDKKLININIDDYYIGNEKIIKIVEMV